MKLTDYMKSRSITDSDMASMVPCSEGAVRKWRYGERVPRGDQIRRIAELTGGEVTANDFYGEFPQLPHRQPIAEAG